MRKTGYQLSHGWTQLTINLTCSISVACPLSHHHHFSCWCRQQRSHPIYHRFQGQIVNNRFSDCMLSQSRRKQQLKQVSLKVLGLFSLLTLSFSAHLRTAGIPNHNIRSKYSPVAEWNNVTGFSFEVFGKVQGVSFRKYTQQQALALDEVKAGWIRNTHRGTVEGQILCQSNSACHEMKEWLQTVGSPKSKIDHAEFTNLNDSTTTTTTTFQELLEFETFAIRKSTRRKR